MDTRMHDSQKGDAPQPVSTSVAEPAEASESSSERAGAANMGAVLEHLVELRAAFDSKLRYDTTKDLQIEQLHAELETYKRGERDSMQRAILVDMIRLYDDMTDLVANSGLPADASMQRSLVAFQKGILETLRRNGIEPYRVEGAAYDRTQQRPLQSVATQDPALDMQVARHVRLGFRSAERIIRQEIVDVFRYVPL